MTRVIGDGPIDLIWVPGWISNVEESWDAPQYDSSVLVVTADVSDQTSASRGARFASGGANGWTPGCRLARETGFLR
jgi:hypothetical protein